MRRVYNYFWLLSCLASFMGFYGGIKSLDELSLLCCLGGSSLTLSLCLPLLPILSKAVCCLCWYIFTLAWFLLTATTFCCCCFSLGTEFCCMIEERGGFDLPPWNCCFVNSFIGVIIGSNGPFYRSRGDAFLSLIKSDERMRSFGRSTIIELLRLYFEAVSSLASWIVFIFEVGVWLLFKPKFANVDPLFEEWGDPLSCELLFVLDLFISSNSVCRSICSWIH